MAVYGFGSFTRDRTYGIAGTDPRSGCRLIEWHIETAGGNAGNVLRTVAAAGADARAIGALGDDPAGHMVRHHLECAGVNVATLPLLQEAITKEVLALVDLATGSHEFYFLDGNDASYSAPLPVQFDDGDVLVLDEASRAALGLAARAKRSGCRVYFNLGSFKGDVHELVTLADSVVCSAGLIGAVYPGATPKARAQHLLKHNSNAEIVLTFGAGGLLHWHKGVEQEQPAVSARVVSTIGAGDSLVAGLVLGTTMALDIGPRLLLGVHMAAACCSKTDTALTSEEVLFAARQSGVTL